MEEPDWKTKAATYKAVLLDTADAIDGVTRSTPLPLGARTTLDAQSEAIREITAE